jgi:hypothetical protein
MNSDFQFFNKLPSSLYYELRNFLKSGCYFNLLTSSKALQPVLHETRIVVLRRPEELEVILTKIMNPRLQLIIQVDNMGNFYHTSTKLMELPSYKLTLWNQLFINSHHLLSDWSNIVDCHTVLEVENVDIEFPQRCSSTLQEVHMSFPGKIEDLSALSNLKKLYLGNCDSITSVDCLRTLSCLEICYCPWIIDVRALGKIPDLSIHHCSGIVDISGFTSNTKLMIVECDNINPATMNFRHVRFLETDLIRNYNQTTTLEKCYSLKLRSKFLFNGLSICTTHKRLREVSITECFSSGNQEENGVSIPKAVDLGNFSHLFRMTLSNISYPFLDFSPLHSVPIVELAYLKCKSLAGLGGNRSVSVCFCREVEDFSPLRNVHTVEICYHDTITNGEGLENVVDLVIDCCPKFRDTSALKDVKRLVLNSCGGLHELQNLENIPVVRITNCRNLTNFGLGNNEKIIIDKRNLAKLLKNPRITLTGFEISCPSNLRDGNLIILLRKLLPGGEKVTNLDSISHPQQRLV